MKVYSATQFFNELDLLELRLETLDPVVDYFIISESRYTHSNLEKPFYYHQNKDRFKKFHHKIINVMLDDVPRNYEEVLQQYALLKDYPDSALHKANKRVIEADWFDKNVDSYVRDTFEKEFLIWSLIQDFDDSRKKASPNDIILIGDLDEIPRPSKVELLKKTFDFLGRDNVYHFQHDMFYYYLNLQKTNEPWLGTMAMSVETALKNSICRMRTEKPGMDIPYGGWHFTYMGGADKVRQKINSWGEQSLNIPGIQASVPDNIKNCLKYKHDLFYRPAQWEVRDINDGTFPKYLVENQDLFKEHIYK